MQARRSAAGPYGIILRVFLCLVFLCTMPPFAGTDGGRGRQAERHTLAPMLGIDEALAANYETTQKMRIGGLDVFLRCLPELSAGAALLIAGRLESVPQLLFLAILLRTVWFLATAAHEYGHVLGAFLAEGRLSIGALLRKTRGVHLTPLLALLPFFPLHIPGLTPEKSGLVPYAGGLLGDGATPFQVRITAAAGLALNAAVLAAALLLPAAGLWTWVRVALIAANAAAFLTSWDDVFSMLTGVLLDPERKFHCGVMTFWLEGAGALDEYLEMAKTAKYISRIRGEQAGGDALLLKDGSYLLVRKVNPKRDDLPEVVDEALRAGLKKELRRGNLARDHVVGVGHLRFGTSEGGPSEMETHPHIWTRGRTLRVWTVENGRLQARERVVESVIVHNGDFDAFHFDFFPRAGEQAYSDIGEWLARVLDAKYPTKGDSPKIAGMMELLITQGVWDASLRLAYQTTMAGSFDEAFDPQRGAPSAKTLAGWGKTVEAAFEQVCAQMDLGNLAAIEDLASREETLGARLTAAVRGRLGAESGLRPEKLDAFIGAALAAFIHNDAQTAVTFFMSPARVRGTFGLAVHTSLKPEQLVFFSHAQPLSVGFNETLQVGGAFSEAANVRLSRADGTMPMQYRLDLEDQSEFGEIAVKDADGLRVYAVTGEGGLSDVGRIRAGADGPDISPALRERVVRIDDPANPYLTPLPVIDRADPVGAEIRSIPATFAQIRESFREEEGAADTPFNLRTARDFSAKIRRKLQRGAAPAANTLDVVFLGEENNEAVGAEAAQDMQEMFPGLKVGFMHPNEILQGDTRGRIGPGTIVLALSHSGQTFATANAVAEIERLRRERQRLAASRGLDDVAAAEGGVYVMCGEIDTPMARAVGQKIRNDSPFCEKIFTTYAGRTVAEPSTLASAAMVQTVSELIYFLLADTAETGGAAPLAPERLRALRTRMDDMIDVQSRHILGVDASGVGQDSDVHRGLVHSGRAWARYITETPRAWWLGFVFILVTVTLHVSPVGTLLQGPLALAGLLGLHAALPAAGWGALVLGFADAVTYGLLGYLVTYAIRLVQRRPVNHRLGMKTVLIGADSVRNEKLLYIYAAKLSAMAYPWTTWQTHAGTTTRDFLGRMNIRNVRGTLAFFMDRDTRAATPRDNAIRSSQKMVRNQMAGVRNAGLPHLRAKKRGVFAGLTAPVKAVFNRLTAPLREMRQGPVIFTIGYDPAKDSYVSLTQRPYRETPAMAGDPFLRTLLRDRVESMETLLGAYVFFHAMAKKVSGEITQKYDMSRGQSGAKIQTTASPTGVDRELINATLGASLLGDLPEPAAATAAVTPAGALEVQLDTAGIAAVRDPAGRLTAEFRVENPQTPAVRLPRPPASSGARPAASSGRATLAEFEGWVRALSTGAAPEAREELLAKTRAVVRDDAAWTDLACDPERTDPDADLLTLALSPETPASLARALAVRLAGGELDEAALDRLCSAARLETEKAGVRKTAVLLLGLAMKRMIEEHDTGRAGPLARRLLDIGTGEDLPVTVMNALIEALGPGAREPLFRPEILAYIEGKLESGRTTVVTAALKALREAAQAGIGSPRATQAALALIGDDTAPQAAVGAAGRFLAASADGVRGFTLEPGAAAALVHRLTLHPPAPVEKTLVKTLAALMADGDQALKTGLCRELMKALAAGGVEPDGAALALLSSARLGGGKEERRKNGFVALAADLQTAIPQALRDNRLTQIPDGAVVTRALARQGLLAYLARVGKGMDSIDARREITRAVSDLAGNCCFSRYETARERLTLKWPGAALPETDMLLLEAA